MQVINSAYKSLKDDEVRLDYDKRNREPIRMTSSKAGGFGKKKDPSPTVAATATAADGDDINRVVVEKGKKGKKSSRTTVKEDTAI